MDVGAELWTSHGSDPSADHSQRRGRVQLAKSMPAAHFGGHAWVQVGNVTRALRDKGMLNNTLLVFSADNGGEQAGDNYPFIQSLGLQRSAFLSSATQLWMWHGSKSCADRVQRSASNSPKRHLEQRHFEQRVLTTMASRRAQATTTPCAAESTPISRAARGAPLSSGVGLS